MALSDLVYKAYEKRLIHALRGEPRPAHVGLIIDGNRRWAKEMGLVHPEHGHSAGAAKILELLQWCDSSGVDMVTVWLLSTDNLSRPASELQPLLGIIEGVVSDLAAEGNRWDLRVVGALDLLPAATATKLKELEAKATGRPGVKVNVAVGYGGRQEIADAVRELLLDAQRSGSNLAQVAEDLTVESIGEHLYTRGQPDPDLVIRTSGEQRLSGFLLWQSAHSEFWFCDAYWPAFRRVDFLRALREYSQRHRRFGG